jgi:hypothetical protein
MTWGIIELLLQSVAFVLGVSAIGLATWAISADHARRDGRVLRRCPKCWYDMSASTGRICPECAHNAKTDRHLTRTRRHYLRAACALLLFVPAVPLWHAPDVRQNGWKALVPDTALMLWPCDTRAWWEAYDMKVSVPPNDRVQALMFDRATADDLEDLPAMILAWRIKRAHAGVTLDNGSTVEVLDASDLAPMLDTGWGEPSILEMLPYAWSRRAEAGREYGGQAPIQRQWHAPRERDRKLHDKIIRLADADRWMNYGGQDAWIRQIGGHLVIAAPKDMIEKVSGVLTLLRAVTPQSPVAHLDGMSVWLVPQQDGARVEERQLRLAALTTLVIEFVDREGWLDSGGDRSQVLGFPGCSKILFAGPPDVIARVNQLVAAALNTTGDFRLPAFTRKTADGEDPAITEHVAAWDLSDTLPADSQSAYEWMKELRDWLSREHPSVDWYYSGGLDADVRPFGSRVVLQAREELTLDLVDASMRRLREKGWANRGFAPLEAAR